MRSIRPIRRRTELVVAATAAAVGLAFMPVTVLDSGRATAWT